MSWSRNTLLAAALSLAVSTAAGAQQLRRSQGMVPAQLRHALDLGVAAPSRPLRGMLLVLKRTPQQEQALQQLMAEQQTPGSPNYHHWLSPVEFGERYGPSDEQIAQVTAWLASQGLTVDRVAAGRNVVEFSGTAGTVAQAFHTELHQYLAADNTRHWANNSNPAIPASLASIVQGVASLNNFVKRAGHAGRIMTGQLSRSGHDGPALNNSDGSHAIVPSDFAVLYNVNPLYNASPAVNGQGQAIAIVGRSDVNLQDIQNFRNLFVPSNPGNLPTVIHNGPAPGEIPGDEDEADLDLEWSGGVAPNAKIYFVVSATTDTTDGVDLSAEYIVNNNLAPVMSTSFSACEAGLGTNENAFIASIYEQAAAQGITVIDSSGDSGAAGCDPNDGSEPAATQGLAVSGLASTPFSTGVGGSMFVEGSNSSAFWSASNDPTTHASALGPIPETVWNESCLGTQSCDQSGPLSASGGGKSLIYTQPSWQNALGVPTQSGGSTPRYVPDVSFSAAGHDGYVVCSPSGTQDPTCTPDSNGKFSYFVFAGTSASAPSFAGVMALVDQKASARQGLANVTLYALARSAKQNYAACNSASSPAASCVFLDVTSGNNSVPCAGGSSGCSATKAGSTGTLTGFAAGQGYDLATGLGSINVANLVNDWSSAVPALASTTTLAISPTTFQHGAVAHVHVEVTRQGGSLGPTGDVSLIAQLPGGGTAGIDFGTLGLGGPNCSSGTTPCLDGGEQAFPGGTYTVIAHYAGDGSFAPSDSAPVTLTVAPEASATAIGAFEANAQGQETPVSTATYGDLIFLDSQVQGASQVACGTQCNAGIPSGTVAFTNSGAPFTPPGFSSNTLALNSEGAADFPGGVTTIPPGSYSITASYSGDTSFTGSASTPLALSVKQAPTNTSVSSAAQGSSSVLTASITTTSFGLPPTGTVTFFSGSTNLGTAQVAGGADQTTGFANGTATLTVPTTSAGAALAALYSGDTNYLGSPPYNVTPSASTATVTAGSSATYTLSLVGVNGFSGTVALACAGAPAGATCTANPASVAVNGSAAASATVTVATTARGLLPAPPEPGGRLLEFGLLLALGGLLIAGTRSRRLRLAGALALAGCAVACGGGGGGNGGGGSGPTGTPAGTYTLTVSATSGTSVSQVPLTLVVQ